MYSLLDLFISFLIIGVGAYGGGLVTVPLIQHEIVVRYKLLTLREMSELLAIAQMTPGPISINTATFTGYRLAGITGSILATIAVVLPSIVFLTLLTPIIAQFKENRQFYRLNKSLQLGVLSLIIFAVWSFGSAVIEGYLDFGIAFTAFLLLIISERRIHPIIIVLICGVIGLFFF